MSERDKFSPDQPGRAFPFRITLEDGVGNTVACATQPAKTLHFLPDVQVSSCQLQSVPGWARFCAYLWVHWESANVSVLRKDIDLSYCQLLKLMWKHCMSRRSFPAALLNAALLDGSWVYVQPFSCRVLSHARRYMRVYASIRVYRRIWNRLYLIGYSCKIDFNSA